MSHPAELFSRFFMARRIDHTVAKFPSPTTKLLEQAAESAYLSFCIRMNVVPIDWHKIDDDLRDAYIEMARATFAVFAVAGGATVDQL